jgi:hypothetical protein
MRHIIYFLLVALLCNCAQVVPPSGGKKDDISPNVATSVPANFSTHFNSKTIVLEFNEYVKLNNPGQNVIVSPSLKEKPTYTMKGKRLYIELSEELEANTTYTINFGTSISDVTENNKAENMKYVFSTGSYLDSLQFSGKVIDAFNMKPLKGVTVMLYDQFDDSIPAQERPRYFAKTNKKGEFNIPFVKDGEYKGFALTDLNNNYLFDMPARNEPVAYVRGNMPRTEVVFRMFTEDSEKQYLKSSNYNAPGKVTLIFNHPVENLKVSPISTNYIEEVQVKGDTVFYWNTTANAPDSLELIVVDDQMEADTVKLRLRKASKKSPIKLHSGTNATMAFNPNKSVKLSFNHPIAKFDTAAISITKDSLPIEFTVTSDTLAQRNFYIHHKWEGKADYKIIIAPGAFTDIYGYSNDTISTNMKIQREEYYGSMNLTVTTTFPEQPYVLQLLNGKGKVLREHPFVGNASEVFSYLNPGTYGMKLIYDNNANGKWDTGDYLEGVQPESVLYFKEQISIRSRWDIDQGWNIE